MIKNELPISFEIGDQSYFISLDELYIRREQYYRFEQKGLVNVKKDLYDFSDSQI